MKVTGAICLALLAIYSGTLIWLELHTSQDHVRQYFTDIDGDVIFYAVNTSLSSFLLAAAGLLLAFAGTQAADQAGRRPFLLSQAAMFGALACDDRFQLHERIGYRLGIEDHYVLLAVTFAELCLLARYCRPSLLTLRMAVFFLLGSLLSAVTLLVDAAVPPDMLLRLSIEDLAKSWGAAMFFGFGWEAARFHLGCSREPSLLGPASDKPSDTGFASTPFQEFGHG